MVKKLRRALGEAAIKDFKTDYRVKGVYSFYRKLARKDNDVTRIHDIVALRVVVGTIADCYRVLGVVHELWQPLPNKIKDYIAFPKPNGYQSLHTTVFTGDGGIVEVQIRTQAMHEEAEYGIASHVSYKEGDGGRSSFDWIRSLIPGFSRKLPDMPQRVSGKQRYGSIGGPSWLESLSSEEDDPDFETALRTDLFSHRVFVFTPKGDVVDLPVSATPIDFAYAIHSDIGDHIAGTKVNGKLVPLDTVLHNGDIVQIETKKNARPTSKWMDAAKTALARRHIRMALDKQPKK
jgi:GTP diphosphokinase / guanosine-3',5'-bis(diphosphate) 3'-diphosphatase